MHADCHASVGPATAWATMRLSPPLTPCAAQAPDTFQRRNACFSPGHRARSGLPTTGFGTAGRAKSRMTRLCAIEKCRVAFRAQFPVAGRKLDSHIGQRLALHERGQERNLFAAGLLRT